MDSTPSTHTHPVRQFAFNAFHRIDHTIGLLSLPPADLTLTYRDEKVKFMSALRGEVRVVRKTAFYAASGRTVAGERG